jgi:TPP-dependent pyruvate/acetoin dehydrogenase alpha subunit
LLSNEEEAAIRAELQTAIDTAAERAERTELASMEDAVSSVYAS